MSDTKLPEPWKPRKFKAKGGPMDGVMFKHYPDSTITKNGKVWNFNDIRLMYGTYILEDKTARWDPKVEAE